MTIARISTIAFASTVFAMAAGMAGAAEKVDPPAGAKPLTAPELLQIYGGKSWDWGAPNAAYFSKDEGRPFTAVVKADWGVQYAEGRWVLSDSGRLCFEADWVSTYGRFPAVSCYLHVAANGVIYQRSLPEGEWEILRHAQVQPEDGINALVEADLVSERFAAARAEVDAAVKGE